MSDKRRHVEMTNDNSSAKKKKRICSLKSHYLNEKTSDVTLAVGEEHVIPAHKVVLSSVSDYFQRIIYTNNQNNIDLINLGEETDPKHVLRHLLKIVYDQHVDSTWFSADLQLAIDVFFLARRLEMTTIWEQIGEELSKLLTKDNFLQLLPLIMTDMNSHVTSLAIVTWLKENREHVFAEVCNKGQVKDIQWLARVLQLSPKDLLEVLIGVKEEEDKKKKRLPLEELFSHEELDQLSFEQLLRLNSHHLFHSLDQLLLKKFAKQQERCLHLEALLQQVDNAKSKQDNCNQLVDNYRDAKKHFQPFLDGQDSVRVNQFVYSKTSYLGKKNFQNFEFKY